jgi:hypothetical protein
MRRTVQLSGLVLAALTFTACVAGPGAAGTATPSNTPGTSGKPSAAPTQGPTSSPSAPAIEHPTGKDALVLRITIDGGFVPPNVTLTTLPVLSIYGDGRVIVQGPQLMIYPGPAMPNLQVRNITEEGLQKVLAAAVEAGLLGPDAHYDDGGMIADAATTTFYLNAGGRLHTISAYALSEQENAGPNLSKEDAAARELLREFFNKVTDLPSLAGADELTAEQAYEPHAVRLFISDQPPYVDESNPEQDAIEWPLETPLAEIGQPIGENNPLGLDCALIEGADLDTLLPLLEKANPLTPWTSEGKTYSLFVRPLLPDEAGCPEF